MGLRRWKAKLLGTTWCAEFDRIGARIARSSRASGLTKFEEVGSGSGFGNGGLEFGGF